MFSLLLAIIYLAFISLGLPDSILGAAWPVMQGELGAPLSCAGVLSMIIAGGTIVSSLLSDRLTLRLGTGRVTALSVAVTAAALAGFSAVGSFATLCLWAVPYGLGAGAVDAALNNYVALHFSARHMSWLHCFWGVGASAGPVIMGFCLTAGWGWRSGYRTIAILQAVLTVCLILALPLWRGGAREGSGADKPARARRLREIVSIRGVPLVLAAFLSYCAIEATTGLWASSYLVEYRGVDEATAARFAALFYLGITFGRFVCGFVADRLGDRRLIRWGAAVMLCGVILLALPGRPAALTGLIVIGLGCAPIYPSIIHATPQNFGAENTQAVVGVQMASAYTGTTLMPPLFGLIAERSGLGWYPVFLGALTLLVLTMTERLNRLLRGAHGNNA